LTNQVQVVVTATIFLSVSGPTFSSSPVCSLSHISSIHSPQVLYVSQRLLDMGCYEISLGDTIGTGAAGSTHRLLDTVTKAIPADKLAVHFHDTYGQVRDVHVC
jgi:isopropylmalate/homocitrate/citramalate synthase